MNQPILIALENFPADGGMVYAETNLRNLIPEPLNALTAFLFMLLAIYWLYKLKGFSTRSVFLSVATYLLLIGSIGGTIYHGLRLYSVFIYLDWLPILLLSIMTSAYFWAKVLQRKIYAVGIIVLFVILRFILREYLFEHLNLNGSTSLNYAIMVLTVFTPLLIYQVRTRFLRGQFIFFAIGCFSLALFFRIADSWKLLSVGTHFLWHFFGALATQLMFRYIYYVDIGRVRMSPVSTYRPLKSQAS